LHERTKGKAEHPFLTSPQRQQGFKKASPFRHDGLVGVFSLFVFFGVTEKNLFFLHTNYSGMRILREMRHHGFFGEEIVGQAQSFLSQSIALRALPRADGSHERHAKEMLR
jgi:hypothetical protein